MAKAVIYFFSGTGNTDFVARTFASVLNELGYNTDVKAIDFLENIEIESYDLVGFGYPVYSFGPALPMLNFINNFPVVSNKKAFTFCTMGGMSGGSEHFEAKKLKKKGFDVIGAYKIRMPHNYPTGYVPKKKSSEKMAGRAKLKITGICKSVVDGRKKHLKFISLMQILLYLYLYKMFNKFKRFGRSLYAFGAYADNKCTECGLCVRMCPVKNIFIKNNVVQFGADCTYCLRCLHNCPVSAIQYKKKTLKRDRYRGPLGDYRPPLNDKL